MVSGWKKRSLSGGFPKEVGQLGKGLAEAQRRIGETPRELGNARMENGIPRRRDG
jgi:hypothetical protein